MTIYTLMGKHDVWRRSAKKARRKKLRTLAAAKRDELIKCEEQRKESSPRYQQWLNEQKELEKFTAEQELKIREEREKKWIEDDKLAHEKWKNQQEILKKESIKKAKQQQLIREEWEQEQKILEEKKEKKRLEEEAQKQKRELLIAQIDEYMKGEREDLPDEFKTSSETQPGKAICPFFAKTGACRYKNECSRNHVRPGISKILLFPGLYNHFSLDGAKHGEYDTDISLEYEHSETYKHFIDFYNDVKHELDKYGKLTQLKVCRNTSFHLRGNVYISYSSEREALNVFRSFNGRYYAGRRVAVEFINIPEWKSAICGLQYTNKCPKGGACNFLHVFKNPGRQFHNADRVNESILKRSRDEWRWSESPPSDHSHEYRKNHKTSKRKSSSKRSHRSRSRSKSRNNRKRKRSSERNNHSNRKRERRRSRSRDYWKSSSSDDESRR